MRRGFLWSAEGKQRAEGLAVSTFGSSGNGNGRVYSGMGDSQ
jgi:hypothetical protein